MHRSAFRRKEAKFRFGPNGRLTHFAPRLRNHRTKLRSRNVLVPHVPFRDSFDVCLVCW
ncbi:MAG: hypothetical protein ACTS47_01205 [Candidatus Hodgkinia cicadicola]